MLVRDWMTPEPVTVSPQTSLLNVRRILLLHRIRHLPVVEGEAVVGIISDRDVAVGDPHTTDALSRLQSDLLSGRYRSAAEVMSTPVQVCAPGDPVSAAARTMLTRRIGALPVVEDGRLVGIVSTVDCLRALIAAERGVRTLEKTGSWLPSGYWRTATKR
jgi:acetoin utilization protein AcuB